MLSAVQSSGIVANNLLGKITSTTLPSAFPTDQLPQVFSDFFVNNSKSCEAKVGPPKNGLHGPKAVGIAQWLERRTLD